MGGLALAGGYGLGRAAFGRNEEEDENEKQAGLYTGTDLDKPRAPKAKPPTRPTIKRIGGMDVRVQNGPITHQDGKFSKRSDYSQFVSKEAGVIGSLLGKGMDVAKNIGGSAVSGASHLGSAVKSNIANTAGVVKDLGVKARGVGQAAMQNVGNRVQGAGQAVMNAKMPSAGQAWNSATGRIHNMGPIGQTATAAGLLGGSAALIHAAGQSNGNPIAKGVADSVYGNRDYTPPVKPMNNPNDNANMAAVAHSMPGAGVVGATTAQTMKQTPQAITPDQPQATPDEGSWLYRNRWPVGIGAGALGIGALMARGREDEREKRGSVTNTPLTLEQMGDMLAKVAATSLHRTLSADEQNDIDQSSSRLMPDMLVGAGTPLHRTMASPTAGAGIYGTLGAGAGGLIGAGIGSLAGSPLQGAAIGAGIGGVAGGAAGYHSRARWNEDTADLMRRLPAGATYRDMQADKGDDDYATDRAENLKAMRYIARNVAGDSQPAMR